MTTLSTGITFLYNRMINTNSNIYNAFIRGFLTYCIIYDNILNIMRRIAILLNINITNVSSNFNKNAHNETYFDKFNLDMPTDLKNFFNFDTFEDPKLNTQLLINTYNTYISAFMSSITFLNIGSYNITTLKQTSSNMVFNEATKLLNALVRLNKEHQGNLETIEWTYKAELESYKEINKNCTKQTNALNVLAHKISSLFIFYDKSTYPILVSLFTGVVTDELTKLFSEQELQVVNLIANYIVFENVRDSLVCDAIDKCIDSENGVDGINGVNGVDGAMRTKYSSKLKSKFKSLISNSKKQKLPSINVRNNVKSRLASGQHTETRTSTHDKHIHHNKGLYLLNELCKYNLVFSIGMFEMLFNINVINSYIITPELQDLASRIKASKTNIRDLTILKFDTRHFKAPVGKK